MPNLYKGEVEIRLNHSIAKKLLQPHGKVYLKFNMESLGMMERTFKREFGTDTSIFEILQRNQANPVKVSVYETTVMLEYGLRDQFPGMTYSLAAAILDQEDMQYVLGKILEGINVAFKGSIPEAEPDTEPAQDRETLMEEMGAVEGEGGKAKKS